MQILPLHPEQVLELYLGTYQARSSGEKNNIMFTDCACAFKKIAFWRHFVAFLRHAGQPAHYPPAGLKSHKSGY
jgi:hypothetical protein